jgi:copper chaperone CopZ
MIQSATRVGLLLFALTGLVGCDAAPASPIGGAAPDLAAESSGIVTAELMVEGVDCASCAVDIRRELRRLNGVLEIRAGASKTHVLVDFIEARVAASQILAAVQAAGYEVEMLVHARRLSGA